MKIKDSRKIINLCNSKIGFEGNIGKRTGYILKKLEDIDLKSYSISRNIIFLRDAIVLGKIYRSLVIWRSS